jgi:dephospho-CoA kinase
LEIIGVTGGIGSGKSSVAKILCNLGASVIDADKITKEIMVKGHPVIKDIVAYFGRGVLNEKGELNRKILGEIVFNDHKKLDILNTITHKYVEEIIKERLSNLKKSNSNIKVAVLDAPLPVKKGFLDVINEAWVVVAKKDERIERIIKRNNFTYEEALLRIKMQKSDEEYIKIADEVIENNETLEELEKLVVSLYLKRFN